MCVLLLSPLRCECALGELALWQDIKRWGPRLSFLEWKEKIMRNTLYHISFNSSWEGGGQSGMSHHRAKQPGFKLNITFSVKLVESPPFPLRWLAETPAIMSVCFKRVGGAAWVHPQCHVAFLCFIFLRIRSKKNNRLVIQDHHYLHGSLPGMSFLWVPSFIKITK